MSKERDDEYGMFKHMNKTGEVSYQIEKTCGLLGTYFNLSLWMTEEEYQHITKNPEALKLVHASMQVTVGILEQMGYPEEDKDADEPDTPGSRNGSSEDAPPKVD